MSQLLPNSQVRRAISGGGDAVEQTVGDHPCAPVHTLGRGRVALDLGQRFAKQIQPSCEMRVFKTGDGEMRAHRTSRILSAVVKHGAPEALHTVEMERPIRNPVGEKRPKNGIVAHLGVEPVDHGRNESGVDAEIVRFLSLSRTRSERMVPGSCMIRMVCGVSPGRWHRYGHYKWYLKYIFRDFGWNSNI